jgi:hypothetical protein
LKGLQAHHAGMPGKHPLTIEIIGLEDGNPVVLDRVIGGSMFLEEAKRIGHHLLSIADPKTPPDGYSIYSHDHELIYTFRLGQVDEIGDKHTEH